LYDPVPDINECDLHTRLTGLHRTKGLEAVDDINPPIDIGGFNDKPVALV